jgi:deoxycytidine triphosphate deaminase
MLLNSNQISEYIIESEFSKRAQIGIDLSVCKVEQVNAGSEVYLDGTKIDGSAYHEVPLIEENGKEVWDLQKGVYSLTFNEGIKVPVDLCR